MTSLNINGCRAEVDVKAIFLDKDGTLVDAHVYWASMIRMRAQGVIESFFRQDEHQQEITRLLCSVMGLDEGAGRIRPEGPVGVAVRTNVLDSVLSAVAGYDNSITFKDLEGIFLELDERSYGELGDSLQLLPGVYDFLKKASSADMDLVLVSTDLTERCEKTLDLLGISKFFTAIYGGDSVENTKPAPDLVLKGLTDGGYSAADAIVIGDHPVDIKMGLAAGISHNIGVLSGLSSLDAFSGLQCSIIPDFHALSVA